MATLHSKNNSKLIHLREATKQDHEDIREIHLRAFPEGEQEIVAALAVKLLNEKSDPKTISLVAEAESALVGHTAFSPVTTNNDENQKGYILAPLGVLPKYQKQKIGSRLIRTGMEQLKKIGVHVLFVYGDPNYYCKFGFNADLAAKYVLPYDLQFPFGWQAVILNKGGFTKSAVKISCVDSLNDPDLW